jgi:dolichol-phosphate mannosyltransferase
MQDPPELVPLLLAKWREGNRIVWGAREKRDDPFFTILFSRLYSSLMRRLALTNMPPSGVDVCMIDRRVIDEVLRMQEKNTSLIGLIMWSGYNQAFVPYQRRARAHGESKWTLAKKLKMFVDSFVSFSFFPIRMVSYLGLSISMLGFAYALFIIARRIVYDTPIVGWSSLMVAITTLSGIQLIMLGVVAEYLWRTFDETRRRPPYIVNELIGFEDNRPRPFERRKS